jgi:hypothetical protein
VSAIRTPQLAFDDGVVFTFKDSQAGVEQPTFRDDHDVDAAGGFVTTKNLSNQSLSAVSLDRAT